MAKTVVRFTLNGNSQELFVEPFRTLLEVVREDLALTGSKEGCGTGDCGACTMTVDGRIVNSCLTLIPEVDGATVVSVEGLAADGKLHAVQQAFIDYAGLQCGFCIPGMLVSAKALIDANPHANEEQVRTGLAGNLCRCTGYDKIVKAVLSVTNGDPVPVGVANASTKASTVEGGSPVIMFQE